MVALVRIGITSGSTMNKRTELAVDIVLGLAYTAATVILLRIFYEALVYVPADY